LRPPDRGVSRAESGDRTDRAEGGKRRHRPGAGAVTHNGEGCVVRQGVARRRAEGAFTGGAWHPDMTLSSASCRRAWHPLAAAPSRCASTDAGTETGRAAVEDRGRRAGTETEQKKAPQMRGFSPNNFPAATYSPTPQGCSTIGPEGLSCRVRNGIGRFPHGITTGKKLQPPPSRINAQTKQSNK
jgi:hypothetical protein